MNFFLISDFSRDLKLVSDYDHFLNDCFGSLHAPTNLPESRKVFTHLSERPRN